MIINTYYQKKVTTKLREASSTITESSSALQLRYLQVNNQLNSCLQIKIFSKWFQVNNPLTITLFTYQYSSKIFKFMPNFDENSSCQYS